MAAAVCFAAMLTLGSLPTIHLENIAGIHSANFTVDQIHAEWSDTVVVVQYSSTISNLTILEPAQLSFYGKLTFNPGSALGGYESGLFYLNVSIDAGVAVIETPTIRDTCFADSFNVTKCSLRPVVSGGIIPGTYSDLILDAAMLAVDGIVKSVQADLDNSCANITNLLGNLLVDAPITTNASALPAAVPGACDVRDSALIRMALNIVKRLPLIDGIRLSLDAVSPSTLSMSITPEDIGPSSFSFGPGSWVFIPAGFSFSFEVYFGNSSCPAPNSIALQSGFELLNLRLTSSKTSEIIRVFNGELAQPLSNWLTSTVRSFLKQDDKNGLTVTIPTQEGGDAPFYTMAAAAAGCFLICIAAAIATYRRTTYKIVLDKYGNEVNGCRRHIGDAILLIGCSTAMLMFAWSNQTGAASVRLGGELDLYSFSLGNSIRDMWLAKLYALSTFIAIFCGFYPYFKLLAIILFAVVLQRPQSRVLHFVDTFGKFSLLDSFVMVIMAESLTIPGICDVIMGASFWVFMAATLLSIALGNYATHGWRAEVNLSDNGALQLGDEDFDGRTHPILRNSRLNEYGSADYMTSPLEVVRLPARRWRPITAGISGVLIVVLFGTTMIWDTVVFNNSGPGALVSGTRIPYTLVALLRKAPVALCVISFVTIFAAPLLFAFGFARSHVLASWCAADVFLVACLAALLQLSQFVNFVLGSTFAGIIEIEAELLWPMYSFGAGAFVVACLIVRNLFL